MNSLIIYPEELQGSQAVLEGDRAKHLYEIHNLRSGDKTRIGIWKGMLGEGEVIEASREKATINVSLQIIPPAKLNISVIVAIPRPPILKRVLMVAASCGVAKVDLVRASGTEKSYLSSRELQPEKIKSSLAAGLEQAIDSDPPAVTIHERFLPFMDNLRDPAESVRLIGDPTGTPVREVFSPSASLVTIAIGPEKGWSSFELNQFDDLGFRRISLGARILRVEVALAYLLGQLA